MAMLPSERGAGVSEQRKRQNLQQVLQQRNGNRKHRTLGMGMMISREGKPRRSRCKM